MYLFLAVLGHCCCAWAFYSSSQWGLLFLAVLGLLIMVASLVVSTSSACVGSVVAARALLLLAMWNLPRPGIKPASLALEGRFLTLDHQGSPLCHILDST